MRIEIQGNPVQRHENYLIAGLSPQDQLRFHRDSEPCDLAISQVISELDEVAQWVYWPITAVIAVVARTKENATVGLGLIGPEGMLGAAMILDALTQPIRAIVQNRGSAWRIDAENMRQQLAEQASMRLSMRGYIDLQIRQFSRSAACSHFHHIQPRLARWLLMSQDRAQSPAFHVTHDFLAQMLGVRRVGITAAAVELQRLGLITYHRGDLTILNRSGLKKAACSCYLLDLKVWTRRHMLAE